MSSKALIMSSGTNGAKKAIDWITKASHVLGQSITILMMFLVASDVVMRYVFNQSIAGALELTELMMVVIVFLAFAYVEHKDGHVRVDLVISLLTPKIRDYLECGVAMMGIAIFSVLALQSIMRFLYLWERGHVTGYLHIPVGPFLLVIAFGCAMTGLQLLLRLLRFVTKIRDGK